jgi:hypothetical protein
LVGVKEVAREGEVVRMVEEAVVMGGGGRW